MHVRLTVKLAEVVEGVDLTAYAEGDVIDLTEREANLLLNGGWAERVPQEERVTSGLRGRVAVAADRTS
jgi:hypothetical protein